MPQKHRWKTISGFWGEYRFCPLQEVWKAKIFSSIIGSVVLWYKCTTFHSILQNMSPHRSDQISQWRRCLRYYCMSKLSNITHFLHYIMMRKNLILQVPFQIPKLFGLTISDCLWLLFKMYSNGLVPTQQLKSALTWMPLKVLYFSLKNVGFLPDYFRITDCNLKCHRMCSGMAALVFRSASPRLLLLCLAPWRPCDVTPRATIAVQPTLPKLWLKLPFPTLRGAFFLLKDFF